MPTNRISITATGRGEPAKNDARQTRHSQGQGIPGVLQTDKEIQKELPTPSHKKREKRVGGVATGDYVVFNHRGAMVHGHGTISHEQVALTKPKWKSIRATWATVLERSHGYQVTYPRN